MGRFKREQERLQQIEQAKVRKEELLIEVKEQADYLKDLYDELNEVQELLNEDGLQIRYRFPIYQDQIR